LGAGQVRIAGAKKNAFIGSAARRSWVGILDMPADLDQRALQRAGLAGEQRAAAVGGQLAVPGQHPDQQEADRVDDDAHAMMMRT
jgi:hypothetical protein